MPKSVIKKMAADTNNTKNNEEQEEEGEEGEDERTRSSTSSSSRSRVISALKEALWQGTVPCEIKISEEELAHSCSPTSYFCEIPRFCRLTAWHDFHDSANKKASEEVYEHFKKYLLTIESREQQEHREQNNDDDRNESAHKRPVWFEYEFDLCNEAAAVVGEERKKRKIPLKWTVPFGVQVDILSFVKLKRKTSSSSSSSSVVIDHMPVQLIARYQQRDELGLEYRHAFGEDARKASKAHFFNTLKEAIFVKTGSSSTVMQLKVQERDDLWESTMTNDFEKSKEAMMKIQRASKLVEEKKMKEQNAKGEDEFCVPVRAYVVDLNPCHADDDDDDENMRKNDMKKVVQLLDDGEDFWEKCVKFCSAPCGRNLTLSECLEVLFEENSTNSRGTKVKRAQTIKIEGIEMEDTKRIGELFDLLHQPDGFIHVVVDHDH